MESGKRGVIMIEKIQKKFALSKQGAKDLVKACIASSLQNISLIFPVGLIYFFVSQLLKNNITVSDGVFYIVGCIVCAAIIFFTTLLQYNYTYYATYRESGVKRIWLAEKLRKIPLSFFGKRDLADLTSTIMSDTAFLEMTFSHYFPQLIAALITAAFVGTGLFFFNWKMALAALWVLPVAFAIVIFSSKILENLTEKQTAAKVACEDGIQEAIETVRDLKSCNAEQKYMEGLDTKIKNLENRSKISEFAGTVFVVSAMLICKLAIASVALMGSVLLLKGSLDVLTFFMFLLVASRIYEPLETALQNLAIVIVSNTSIIRLNKILSEPSQSGYGFLMNNGYDIVFDNVSFSYDKQESVLKNISFTAKQGEVTALVGPSGSGKTTVSRLASRFWDIKEGKITVGGLDISKVDPEKILSLYSIVFQDVLLFDNTILENIRIGKKDATDEQVIKAAKLANCQEFVNKLPDGWNSRIGENGFALSGGERQRLSIARAFLKDAPIILLDEATASLDVENETQVQNAISRLIKNKTVLVIAHRMRTVSGADKIVVLQDGKIAEQGTPEELIDRNGIFNRMMQLQKQSAAWTL